MGIDDKHQDIDFESSNSFIRAFNRLFCNWGQRKVPYDVNGQIKGKTAPLWENPSKTFWLIIFIFSLIMSLLFIASFVVVNYYSDDVINNKNANDIEKNCINISKSKFKTVFGVIGGIILFVNFLCFLFMYCKDYASDQEWSRYLIITAFFVFCMIGFNIADYVITSKNLKFYRDNITNEYDNSAKTCKRVFKANLGMNFTVCIISSIIELIVLIKIFLIGKFFFLNSYVPHTAVCEDEDIIIIE